MWTSKVNPLLLAHSGCTREATGCPTCASSARCRFRSDARCTGAATPTDPPSCATPFPTVHSPSLPYKQQVVHDHVLVDSLHEGADAHHQVRELRARLLGTLHGLSEVAVETLLGTVVGKETVDELRITVFTEADSLSARANLLVLGKLPMSERMQSNVFAVHIEHDHVVHIHSVKEGADAVGSPRRLPSEGPSLHEPDGIGISRLQRLHETATAGRQILRLPGLGVA